MQVMLLAAGRSTRLGSLGEALPKPLVPVCGYPAVTYALALCRKAGLTDVVVNVHHRGDLVRRTLGDGGRFGVQLRYSVEEELLGTGGGIVKARTLFRSEPVLVLNAKVAAEIDLREVMDAHRAAPRGAVATMVLREDPHPEQWAPVGTDTTGRVVSLRGVRVDHTPVGAILDRMFTGVHVLESALLDRLPRGGVSDVVGDAYIPAMQAGERIHSVTMGGYFAEHSTPQRYLEGNLMLLRNPGLLSCPPGPLVGIDDGVQIHPTACLIPPVRILAGAIVEADAVVGPDVVLGAGVRVAAGARITGSVAWERATIEGTHVGTVVTSSG